MKMHMLRRFLLTRSVSPKRLYNLFLCYYEMMAGKTVLISLPLKLTIDPCNVCNLRCPLCPTGQRLGKRKQAMMMPHDFNKIVNEIGDYLYEVALYNWGEPFLNKDIYGMIGLLKKRRIKVTANSNLNVELSKEDAEALVKSGLDVLIVSMDGIRQESYEKYRIGGDLEKVKRNVKIISEAKSKLRSDKPFMIWQFLVNAFNENEVLHLEGVKKDLGFNELWLGKLRCDMDKEIFMSQEERYNNVKSFLPSEKYSRYDCQKKAEKTSTKSCYFLWTTAAINSDGSVSPCCAVYDQKHDFGNVFEKGRSFREIWNGEDYVESRKVVRGKASKKETVCRVCAMHGFIQS